MSDKRSVDGSCTWIALELETVNFGANRLDKRLAVMLEDFSEAPNDSIPIACGGRAEVEAAYRFCDNPRVTPQKILQPHYDSTKLRCQDYEVVIIAQDTTECDFTNPHRQVEGAGPLDNGNRFGSFCHLSEAFTVDGTPLGAIEAKLWSRPSVSKLSAKEKDSQRRKKPIEAKESYRWLESLQATQKLALECPETKFVCVSDSESDMYDFFCNTLPIQC